MRTKESYITISDETSALLCKNILFELETVTYK